MFYEAWSTELTEISLMLRGEEDRIFLEIEYSSKDLEELEDQEENPADLDLF